MINLAAAQGSKKWVSFRNFEENILVSKHLENMFCKLKMTL
jgi:hypothetical protein